jgi:hypothetical protein
VVTNVPYICTDVPISPTGSFDEREFLGNGEWPVGPAASVPPEQISIPSPPVEGVDNALKMVYKMSARPRGIGKGTVWHF